MQQRADEPTFWPDDLEVPVPAVILEQPPRSSAAPVSPS